MKSPTIAGELNMIVTSVDQGLRDGEEIKVDEERYKVLPDNRGNYIKTEVGVERDYRNRHERRRDRALRKRSRCPQSD